MTFSASSFDQSNRCMDYMLPKSMQNKSKLMVLSPLIFQMHPKTPELQPLLFEYSCTTFWNQEQVTDLLQDVHSDTWLSCILLRPRFHWSIFFWACSFEILVHRLDCIHHLWATKGKWSTTTSWLKIKFSRVVFPMPCIPILESL